MIDQKVKFEYLNLDTTGWNLLSVFPLWKGNKEKAHGDG